ncbi:MFS general substrate transporter [Thozetella sp. PMI_491]|nr:MFS general substrate transporter [Thozetella sp. PMI_491]
MTASVAFSSSIYTVIVTLISSEFSTSRLLSELGITTFLFGFAPGPFLFAPLSEFLGRQVVFRATYIVFTFSHIWSALATGSTSLLLSRFVAGFFGSPAVTNSGGTLTDLWDRAERTVPLALFAGASFLGPVLAPCLGGVIIQHTRSWRWNFWVMTILTCIISVFVFILPETYRPEIEEPKTENTNVSSQRLPAQKLCLNLARPWRMLFTEPILLLLSIYMAFLYGTLYLDFTAYPIIYRDLRGWPVGASSLSLLGIGLGIAIPVAASGYIERIYLTHVQKFGTPQPEARLPHLVYTAWLIPVGLFWFAWTASPPTHWISGVVAGVPFGFGLITILLGIMAYLADCYGAYAASALAANSLLRSTCGALFPLFGDKMYTTLGVTWATLVLAIVAFLLAPLPWVFYTYGPRIRSTRKYHIQACGISV